jgi:hypothetical protein
MNIFINKGIQNQLGKTNKILLLILVYTWTFFALNASAESDDLISGEFKIKAAYLYNFLKFTDWEAEVFPDTSETIRITILGEDPFGDAFDRLEGRTIKGKVLQITRISSIQDLDTSHLLYICNSEMERLKEVIDTLKDSGVLTVGESEEFTQQGGIIGFFVEEDAVHFAINLTTAEHAGIKFSSQLLQVARVVRDKQK